MNANEIASYMSSLEQKNAELEQENRILKETNTYLRNMLMLPLTLKQAFEQLFGVYDDKDALDKKLSKDFYTSHDIEESEIYRRFEYSEEYNMIRALYERIPHICR